MFKGTKTAATFILIIVFSLICVNMAASASGQAGNNATAEPSIAPSPTVSPAASAAPTAVPTPAPRQVFSSSPRWDTDHVTITVTNNGDPITVVAWIGDTSNKTTISVSTGETVSVSTPSVQVQDGQILRFGFEAYETNMLIDTNSATITVNLAATPTPLPPEAVTISGTVVDSASGAPVPGAKVTFMPEAIDKMYGPVTADNDGFFSSPKMYAGVRYTIKVSAAGYQAISTVTDNKISEDSTASIPITRLAAGLTPTPSPTSPPTPTSPIDLWVSLVYNPTLCIGTTSSLVAIVLGSIGIYEWMERKRKERENTGKKGEDSKPPKM